LINEQASIIQSNQLTQASHWSNHHKEFAPTTYSMTCFTTSSGELVIKTTLWRFQRRRKHLQQNERVDGGPIRRSAPKVHEVLKIGSMFFKSSLQLQQVIGIITVSSIWTNHQSSSLDYETKHTSHM